jgi:hypothetical protein
MRVQYLESDFNAKTYFADFFSITVAPGQPAVEKNQIYYEVQKIRKGIQRNLYSL